MTFFLYVQEYVQFYKWGEYLRL